MPNRAGLLLVIACAAASAEPAKVSAQTGGSDQSGGPDSVCVSNGVPLGQLDYFQQFGDIDWSAGVKSSYSDPGNMTLDKDTLITPQFGTTSDPSVPIFLGFSVSRSCQVFLDHQTTFMPFVGCSFRNSFVCAGAGPSLSRVGASLNDVVGFANMTGGPPPLNGLVDVSGRPQIDAQTQWAFGIAASVGMTYFFTPSCFLDIGYTFSNPFPFQNDAFSPLVLTGTLIGDYTAKVSTHLGDLRPLSKRHAALASSSEVGLRGSSLQSD
jgi:hypothetical protein